MTERVQRIPDSSDELVLLDYMDGPKVFANLFRRRSDGTEVWRASPPEATKPDAWVQARVQHDAVVANSWSCWKVVLDLASGAERERVFTK